MMLDGYHYTGDGFDKKRRVIAVEAALEIIKAAVAAPTDAKNVVFDLSEACKFIEPLADAIQSAIDKK